MNQFHDFYTPQNQKGKLRNKEYDLVFSSGEEATDKKDLLVDLVSKRNINLLSQNSEHLGHQDEEEEAEEEVGPEKWNKKGERPQLCGYKI